MKKVFLALLVLLCLLCLAAYALLRHAEQRMEQSLLEGLPRLFARQGQAAEVSGSVDVSLVAGRITLRDLSIRQPGDGFRLQVGELSVALDTDHLRASLQALQTGQIATGHERTPLVLDDVHLRGTRLQTADGVWSAQRQQIAHLELSPSLLWALERGSATVESFRVGVRLSDYSARYCEYDFPSLIDPLHLSLRELRADTLAGGRLLRLEASGISLARPPYTVECRLLRHAVLPLADMLDAPDLLTMLTFSLVPASVSSRELPPGHRGDNGWSLEELRCRLDGAPLLNVRRLSWEKDADLDGKDSRRRLEEAQICAGPLYQALGLALPPGLPGDTVWQADMEARSRVTGEGTAEEVSWRTSLTDGHIAVSLSKELDRVWDLSFRYTDKGLLALVAVNRPEALRDPLSLLDSRLPPLSPDLRTALTRLWQQPGSLSIRTREGAVWQPHVPPAATPGDDAPLIIEVEPGPEPLRAQIDRLRKKQK